MLWHWAGWDNSADSDLGMCFGACPLEEMPGKGGNPGGCSCPMLKENRLVNPALSLPPDRSVYRPDRRDPELMSRV